MKRNLAISCFFLLSGCSSPQVKEVELPTILTVDGKDFISAKAFTEHDLKVEKPKNEDFIVSTPENEAPIYLGNWCGVYWSDGLTQGQKILEEADLVLDLKGVREVWVPIEGKPKKLYVFEVR